MDGLWRLSGWWCCGALGVLWGDARSEIIFMFLRWPERKRLNRLVGSSEPRKKEMSVSINTWADRARCGQGCRISMNKEISPC